MNWSWTRETDAGRLVCRPLTPDRFGDIEAVFGERGVARKCFCMHWRRPDGGFGDAQDNRDRFADVTRQGRPPGLIGYLDGVPVAWVQVGPREDFPGLDRSWLLKPFDDAEVWSVNCFVTRVGYRRKGIGTSMLTAAIEYSRAQGAHLIEGYPYDDETTSAVNYFTGTMGMFSEHDFVEVIRRKDTRPIVRLET
jgi:GNAT superfamily N-acetyltransferase